MEIHLACAPATTKHAGVYAAHNGWDGYDWVCPTCGASEIEYGTEQAARAGLAHHIKKTHPEVKPVTQDLQRRDDGGIGGPLTVVELALAEQGYRPAPELSATVPARDITFMRGVDCPNCKVDGVFSPKVYGRQLEGKTETTVLAVCGYCQHAEEL